MVEVPVSAVDEVAEYVPNDRFVAVTVHADAIVADAVKVVVVEPAFALAAASTAINAALARLTKRKASRDSIQALRQKIFERAYGITCVAPHDESSSHSLGCAAHRMAQCIAQPTYCDLRTDAFRFQDDSICLKDITEHGIMREANKRTIKSRLVAIGVLLTWGSLTVADEVVSAPDYIAILPGYSFPSKAYGTTGNGATVSGIYGRELAAHLGFEVNIQSSTFETGTHGGTDFYQNGATVDATYALWNRREETLLTPFALAGVGAVYDDFYPNNRDGIAFILDAGLGVLTRPLFSNGIRLRLDARYVHDGKEGGHAEPRLIAGIEIPLGRVERHIEYLPGKTEIREVIREVPAVPAPVVDSDGDGVDDTRDHCPNTPRGMKVDGVGCVVIQQTFALQGVNFESNKALLTQSAQAQLNVVALAFAGQPSLKVEIAGHTDSVGSVAANLELSQQRAESVRAYLISRGVHPDRLVARGYGKSQLQVNPEKTNEDRERNRRVELRVVGP
jgi:OOP family OmpA-OmpF porin